MWNKQIWIKNSRDGGIYVKEYDYNGNHEVKKLSDYEPNVQIRLVSLSALIVTGEWVNILDIIFNEKSNATITPDYVLDDLTEGSIT